MNIHIELLIILNRYDITNYFQSREEKNVEMPPPTASVEISRELFKRSITKLYLHIWDNRQTFFSPPQNAIKYCTKVRKAGLQDQRVE